MQLFGMATWTGVHKPPLGDFSEGTGCDGVYQNDCAYFNRNFMKGNDCTKHVAEEWKFNWLIDGDGEYDLRKTLLYCDEETKLWMPRI